MVLHEHKHERISGDIFETLQASMRDSQGNLSTYVFIDDGWLCTQYYNKAGASIWRATNQKTNERHFFK